MVHVSLHDVNGSEGVLLEKQNSVKIIKYTQ